MELRHFKNIIHKTNYSTIYKHNNLVLKKTGHINNETQILNNLSHKNIIKPLFTKKTLQNQYIITDYYNNGDLFENFEKKNLNIDDYKTLISKLIKPIYYIHKKNIVHLDLKLENYLLDANNEYILIDFQLSEYHNNIYNTLQPLKHTYGTENYMSPEVKKKLFCKSSDIFSLGCILYMIYTESFYKGIIEYDRLKKYPNNLIDIIENTLQTNHYHRATIYDLIFYYNLT